MEGIYVKCNDDVLIHHGVKNQKWGVRRYQNKDGSLTALGKAHLKDPSVGGRAVGGGDVSEDKKKDKKKEKELSDKEINKYSSDVARGDYGNWGDRVDRLKKKGLSANDIIKIQGKVNESLGVKGGASKQFQDLVKSKFPKTETKKPAQTKKATSTNKTAAKTKTSTKKAAKPKKRNSEIRKQFDYTTKVFKAAAKKQKKVKHSDTGNAYVKIYDDYLEHHGIKGQKWGVRRYQNADGSLTAAGKSRYGDKPKKAGSSDSTKQEKSSPRERAKSMSDQELRDKTNRINLENNYINAMDRNSALYKNGKTKTDLYIEKLEKMNRAGNAIKGIVVSANTISRILKSNKKEN